MDINRIDHPCQRGLTSPQRIDKNGSFSKVLDLKRSEMNQAALQPLCNPETELINQSDHLLALLDAYQKDLRDPSKTLRTIAPFVKEIENHLTNMTSGSEGESAHSKGLGHLIDDLTILGKVAIIKFQRGDFI